MCTYGQGVECLVAHMYGEGSYSWGGKGMRRVHQEATERVGANRLGQNGMRGHVHREGLDGTGDGNKA